MEQISYLEQPNCFRISNGVVDVIVTTAVGPRIVRYGFVGEENLFGELPNESIRTDLGEWKPWGGHRLWTAPEALPRSYVPDNEPISYQIEGPNTIRLTQPVEIKTGMQKEITVTLRPHGATVEVRHRITNHNLWAIRVAPWALTILNDGGVTILPQEPYRSHDEYLLPARPMVIWHYTDLTDPRWSIGKRYILLKTDEARAEPQKMGIANKQGWAAYHRKGALFVKRFGYHEGADYPDCGSNNETYTAGSFMELETLAPLCHLEPGSSAEHTEIWSLFRNVSIGTTEASLDAALLPLLAQAKQT